MGFYIRKSKNFGPFRLNLSKSGLGVSAGVKGARVSFGPKGTYFNGGSNGLYYRKKLKSSNSAKNSATRTNSNKETISKSKNKKGKSPIIIIIEVISLIYALGCVLGDSNFASRLLFIPLIHILIGIYALKKFKNASGSTPNIFFVLHAFAGIYVTLFADEGTVNTLVIAMCIATLVYDIYFFITKNYQSIIGDDNVDDLTLKIDTKYKIERLVNLAGYILYSISCIFVALLVNSIAIVVFILALICFALGLLLEFLYKINFNYELTKEEFSRWKAVCNSMMMIQECNNFFFQITNSESFERVIDYKSKKPLACDSGKRNKLGIVSNCMNFSFSNNGVTCCMLPDRLLIVDGVNAESYYYGDLSFSEFYNLTSKKDNVGNDSIYYRSHFLYTNQDGSRDQRYLARNNPLIYEYKLNYLEIKKGNLVIRIAVSKTETDKYIYDCIKKYAEYVKNEPVQKDYEPDSNPLLDDINNYTEGK